MGFFDSLAGAAKAVGNHVNAEKDRAARKYAAEFSSMSVSELQNELRASDHYRRLAANSELKSRGHS